MHEAKRPYEAPKLVEWGSVVDLTQAPVPCSTDALFSGSVPCDIRYDRPT